jgi:hypothetical protein
MQVTTIEGIVKNGQIVPSEDIKLPEMTTVYIVIPRLKNSKIPQIMSPPLVDKSKLADFECEIIDFEEDEI